jgi:glycyl-tRNA synthetase beta chain
VPTDPVSVAVALADKIDTLTGFWAIDEKPTGSKDPFALRRAALGVIRLVLGNGVRLNCIASINFSLVGIFADIALSGRLMFLNFYELDIAEERTTVEEWLPFTRSPHVEEVYEGRDYREIISLSRSECVARIRDYHIAWAKDVDASGDHLDDGAQMIDQRAISLDLLSFLHDRLKVFLRDQGIRHDVIDACLAMPGNDDLTLLVKRAEALSAVLKTEDGANLLAGFKRANNILTQAEEKDGVEYSYGADPKFAETDSERALFTALDRAEATITPALKTEDFATAMSAMAALRAPIDAFFTDVQVNSDNPIIRRNRLNLLHRIRSVCGQVADLKVIEA